MPSTSNISRSCWKTRVHHLGPDFTRAACLYNVETFFGWVSTVADFCGSLGQIAPDPKEP